MKKAIPIGIEFYKEMIDKDYYYVDKTMMIKELLDNKAKVSLFTRPRRFGKTLTLTMLQAFFEAELDREGKPVDNSRYFEGRKIWECGDEYTEKMGKYPVIRMTLKSAKQPTFEMAYNVLRENIRDEFIRHKYVLQGDLLDKSNKEQYLRICSYEKKADANEYATALAFLSKCLEEYHGRKTVILIDEYDVPLENAHFQGFYDEMVGFIRSLFESALKTNESLELAVVTGCLRISKESIFTGLNNLAVISVLNDRYAEHFGFTQEEVDDMLAHYDLMEKREELKKWYDGYLFGDTEIYNPWSVINYVNTAAVNPNAMPMPYWSNTSSNTIIRELIEKSDKHVKAEIEELIAGGTIEKPIHEDITYGDIHKTQDNLWNFLFFTGYLKKVGESRRGRQKLLEMTIPNEEIAYIYEDTILYWFEEKMNEDTTDRTPLYQALREEDCETVEAILREKLAESISLYDAAELFYHGFMTGMVAYFEDYRIKSNRESGNGRPDLVMVPPTEAKPVIIMELKRTDSFGKMEAGCEKALDQIEEKQYDAEYRQIGYTQFIYYGVCFCRKNCRVMGKSFVVE